MNFDNIPKALKVWPNWVCWKYVVRDGKKTKPPVSPVTGAPAKADVPNTWTDFITAKAYYQSHKNNSIAGIGFEVGNTPYVGIDLDRCRDRKTGVIDQKAREEIEKLNTYTEVSPSGTGIRMLAIGQLPSGGRKKGHIEMYDAGRYVTVTGNHLDGTPWTIEKRNAELADMHAWYFGQEEAKKQPVQKARLPKLDASDEELLARAESAVNGEKFKRLWTGNSTGYTSQSEADMALCLQLAFWTGKDADWIDRLFRQSGLCRKKWDERHFGNGKTYGQETIRRAIEKTGETYTHEGRDSGRFIQEESAPLDQDTRMVIPFPDVMDGLAGEFAAMYARSLEVPKPFFYFAFLTCLGSILADRVTLSTEILPQPRLYTVLLGESADDRKSTAINKVTEFFKDTIADFSTCFGVGSAEGLQKRLDGSRSVLLCFDEFKHFVSKCKIESSVLLPCVNTLFESNRYESRTSKTDIKLENAYLSLLAASTVQTYERTWDASFTDIGFNNRLFLVPGTAERRFSFPSKIPAKEKTKLMGYLGKVLRSLGDGATVELDVTPSARMLYQDWYMGLERSVHAKRLDTYALRLMILLAVNELRQEIPEDIVRKATALCDWQLAVRKLHDPIDADNKIAATEEKIRRLLRIDPRTDRDLKRGIHVERFGLWFYDTAIGNLQKAKEIKRDKVSQKWVLI